MQTPLRTLTRLLRWPAFGAFACSTFSGCALLDGGDNRALVTNSAGDIQTVATRADRRIAFVDRNWIWGENLAQSMRLETVRGISERPLPEKMRSHHYCAEPSPDVSADLLAELVTQLGVGQLSLGHDAQLSGSMSAITDPIFNRSQGVQMFRDGLFALCQAHHNGAVGTYMYGSFITALIDRSSYLNALELALSPLANGKQFSAAEMMALLGLVEGALVKLQSPSVALGDASAVESQNAATLTCGPPTIASPTDGFQTSPGANAVDWPFFY